MKYLLLLSLATSLTLSAKNVDYSQIEQGIKHYQQKVIELQTTLDKSIFDNDEILIKFDFDAQNIIAFMQDKFVFQPYVGLLRGVQGTLNSRAGNALDQAVLLAKLLSDAGLEVKIANGQLTEKDIKVLIASTANAQLPKQIGNGEEFEKALAKFNTKKQNKIDWEKSETNKSYNQSKQIIEKLLKDNNVELVNKDITSELIAQSKDYFWVEYRMSPSDEWASAHPAFAKDYPVNVKATSYIKGDIPDKYLHKLKVEAFIQQRIDNKIKTHSLMPAWEKPTANLDNFAITYTNAASGIKLDYDLEQIVKDTTYFIPTFNGNAVGTKVFDLAGRMIDKEAMQSGGAGGLFQAIADKTGGALDKVSGKKSGKPYMQLDAQWLQFTFTQPGGSSFVQKRYLYQAPTKKVDADSKIAAKLALMSQYKFLTSTGNQSNAFLASVYLDLLNAGMPLLKSSAKKVYGNQETVAFPKTIPTSAFELFTQNQIMNNNPNLDDSIIRYKNSANLLGFKRGFKSYDKEIFAVDVISNRQRFIKNLDGKIINQTQVARNHGVWETACEKLPAQILDLDNESLDTMEITKAALRQNIDLKVIDANKPDLKLIESIFSDNQMVINRAKADLSNGYSLIIPAKKPSNLMMSGWWRINTQTGETLGMTADGGGQSATEYAIKHTQNYLSLIRAVGNLKKCEKITSDLSKACCLMEAHVNNVAGLKFGSAFGASFGFAASAVFDIGDYLAEGVFGSGYAPSSGGKMCKGI